MNSATIYTDGSCRVKRKRRDGRGGWATIIDLDVEGSHQIVELSGGFYRTTAMRMELWAIIQALDWLIQPCIVTLFTDVEQIPHLMQADYMNYVRSKGWRYENGQKAKNNDLWEQLLNQCERHTVTFRWIPAHMGSPGNEECDALASTARYQKDLKRDTEYEKRNPPRKKK